MIQKKLTAFKRFGIHDVEVKFPLIYPKCFLLYKKIVGHRYRSNLPPNQIRSNFFEDSIL